MTDFPPDELAAPNEVLFWRDQKIKMQAERDALSSELAAERRRKEFWKANYHTPAAELSALREQIRKLADEWGPQSDDGPVRMVIDCANAADALRALLGDS